GAEVPTGELHDVEARLPERNADHLLRALSGRLADRQRSRRIPGAEHGAAAAGIAPDPPRPGRPSLGLGKLLLRELRSQSLRIILLTCLHPLAGGSVSFFDPSQPVDDGTGVGIDVQNLAWQLNLPCIEVELDVAQGHGQNAALTCLENSKRPGKLRERRISIDPQRERKARTVLELPPRIVGEAARKGDPDRRRLRKWRDR